MKCAIVVLAPTHRLIRPDEEDDTAPRRDYMVLANELGAQIIDAPDSGMVKAVTKKRLAASVAQAWYAFQRRDEYDIILSMSEQVGLPLALMFKMARCRKPHVMVSHYLTPWKKSVFLKSFHVDTHIDKIVTHGSVQFDFVTNDLKIPKEKVETVLHAVDSKFWHPMEGGSEPLIASAGLEYRDYPTLLKAVEGLDVDIMVAAASPWFTGKRDNLDVLPPRVKVVKHSFVELRDLYARSQFVVVPLRPNNTQSGTTVTYEAMSMAKAVITSDNGGHVDVVRHGETGYYVPAQDPQALREMIVRLLDNSEEATRLGAQGRKIVDQGLNVDGYSQRVAQIVREIYDLHTSKTR